MIIKILSHFWSSRYCGGGRRCTPGCLGQYGHLTSFNTSAGVDALPMDNLPSGFDLKFPGSLSHVECKWKNNKCYAVANMN